MLLSSLFIGGCVYVRLLKTKDQLSNFDRYFDTRLEQGDLYFRFLEPHLSKTDLDALDFIPLSKTQDARERAVWKIGLERVREGQERSGGHDRILVDLIFEGEILREVRVPRRYVEPLSPELIVGTAKAMGESRVNPFRRTVSAAWESQHPQAVLPRRAEIEAVLGEANEYERSGDELIATYRYQKAVPDSRSEARDKEHWIKLAYGIIDDRLKRGRSRSVRIFFDKGYEDF